MVYKVNGREFTLGTSQENQEWGAKIVLKKDISRGFIGHNGEVEELKWGFW